jgi:hypothetical protein
MATKSRRAGTDPELSAINVILDALDGLEGESIQRVLDYVIGRLSLPRSKTISIPSGSMLTAGTHAAVESPQGRQMSIRDLKDEKNPTSANQMAALVAYYLSEVAPSEERRDTINTADVQRYFKQAGYKLPKVLTNALTNAAAAGYFDAVGAGMYRLNPVGYNLVAHGLPRGSGTADRGEAGKKR